MPFHPKVGDIIEINHEPLTFMEHPNALGMPYGQRGRKATVFQVRDNFGGYHALKVFIEAFRLKQNARGAVYLKRYASIPGLHVCSRLVLDPETYPSLLNTIPDFLYAVLMPWVAGVTWTDFMYSEITAPSQSTEIALSFATLLQTMERAGIAHCDLSGPNVLLASSNKGISVSLVDVEDMYGPEFERPSQLSRGTSGYGHIYTKDGIWCKEGDRFAGSILLAEMLGWCDERVRRIRFDDAYFDEKELQTNSERYNVLLRVLRERWGERIGQLFIQTWTSKTLQGCPTFEEWRSAILAGPGPTFEEQRLNLDRLVQAGDWFKVVELCDQLLLRDSAQQDVVVIRSQGLQIIEMRQTMDKLLTKAQASGTLQDWQACLAAYKTLTKVAPNIPDGPKISSHLKDEIEVAISLDQAEQLIDRGLWQEANERLKKIKTSSVRYDYLVTRVEQHFAVEIDAQNYLSEAFAWMGKGDWTSAITVCQKGLALGLNREDFQRIFDQATNNREREQKLSNGIRQIKQYFEQKDWKQALEYSGNLLAEYSEDYDVQKIHKQARNYLQYSEKIAKAQEFADSEKHHEALAALKDLPDHFPGTKELRDEIMNRLSLQDRLQEARNSYDPVQVLELLKQATSGSGQTGPLRQWAEEELHLSQKISEAQATYDLDELEKLLKHMPTDHPIYGQMVAWLKEKQELKEKIAQAKSRFDGEELRHVVWMTQPGYPEREELLSWAQQECDRKKRLHHAQTIFDWETVLNLLTEVPENYPEHESLQHWAKNIRDQHTSLESARQKYDLEDFEIKCSQLPENDPIVKESREWVAREKNRSKLIEQASSSENWFDLASLLRDAPTSYPARDTLLDKAETELLKQEKISKVIQEIDLEAAEELLGELSNNSSDWLRLSTWIEQERKKLEQIRTAQLQFRYDAVAKLISDVDLKNHRYAEVQTWLDGWLEAETAIDQAMSAEDLTILDVFLSQLPEGHPRLKQILLFKNEIEQRAIKLAQLKQDAIKALQENRYEMAINFSRQALLLPGGDGTFKEIIAQAESGLEQNQTTRLTLQQVRDLLQKGQIAEALDLCQNCLEKNPRSSEAINLFMRIREEVELRAKKSDQKKNWKSSLQWWKLLIEKGNFPEKVPQLSRQDALMTNAVAAEKRVSRLRQQELRRQGIIILVVVLSLVVVAGLIYLVVDQTTASELLPNVLRVSALSSLQSS